MLGFICGLMVSAIFSNLARVITVLQPAGAEPPLLTAGFSAHRPLMVITGALGATSGGGVGAFSPDFSAGAACGACAAGACPEAPLAGAPWARAIPETSKPVSIVRWRRVVRVIAKS